MNESRSFADGFRLKNRSAVPLIDERDSHYLARREDFALGNTQVRPSIRTIQGPLGEVRMEPRVMQVLLALADASPSVVTREDLNHLCWKDQIVGDDALNRAIKEVRRTGRESGADFTIETIPRIGFLLKEADPDLRNEPLEDAVVLEELPRTIFFSRRAILATSVVAGAGGLAWLVSRPSPADAVTNLMEESRRAMSTGDPAEEERAIKLLERAVAYAPERADTWGLLALSLARAHEHAIFVADEPLTRIRNAVERTLEIEPGNGDALAARAISIPYYGDWLAAERRFDGVISRHPGDIYARDARAFFLGAVGRMKEAGHSRAAFAERAPADANLQYRAVYAHWFLGDIPAADRVALQGLEMWPRQMGLWFARFWVLAGTGRIERALQHLANQSARPLLPTPMFETMRLALEASVSGQSKLRSEAIHRVMTGAQQNVAGVVSALMLLNQIGAIDEAFALSEAYYLERGPILAAVQWRPGQPSIPDQRRRKTNMLFTPTASKMWDDPRFMPMMDEMGLTQYWEQSGKAPDFLV